MNYFLFKLKFDSPVHFGPSDSALSLYSSDDHFCADTLFSALCHAALSLQGEAGLNELCRQAMDGELLLSDAMPWKEETFYLPKPCVSSDSKQELPASQRKAVKKLTWIPLQTFAEFADSVHGGRAYDIDSAKAEFGCMDKSTKAKITDGEDALPYQVGIYRFYQDCGLWFLAGCATEEQGDRLALLLEGLGLSGIGGKTSSGYGKFRIEDTIYLNEPFDDDTEWLLSALENERAPRQLLLSTSLPEDSSLDALLPEAEYRLVRRGGFVQSGSYADESRKKRAQYFLAAGSVLPGRFRPVLYAVGEEQRHPVWRFSGPVMLGVEL